MNCGKILPIRAFALSPEAALFIVRQFYTETKVYTCTFSSWKLMKSCHLNVETTNLVISLKLFLYEHAQITLTPFYSVHHPALRFRLVVKRLSGNMLACLTSF